MNWVPSFLYPEQSRRANLAGCWNWHDPAHQKRGSGEPAMIAGLTKYILGLCKANPNRIYIAGLSAGGAAAAVIGAAYRDLFVAVGVHSGVPRGNVSSLGEAVAAMRGKAHFEPAGRLPPQLPTIVFHGDKDRVVHPSNVQGFLANLQRSNPGPLTIRTSQGATIGGRSFSRRLIRNAEGQLLLEEWTIIGGGHGWSGGSLAGSHTDPVGPNASREMLRFFLARKR